MQNTIVQETKALLRLIIKDQEFRTTNVSTTLVFTGSKPKSRLRMDRTL